MSLSMMDSWTGTPDEWFSFFNGKGLDVLPFLIKIKQRKVKKIDEQIVELKEKLEPLKELPECISLSNQ